MNQPAPGVSATIGLFADIARMRRGPEDLPASATLLLLTMVGYAVVDALLLSVAPDLPGNSVLLIAIDIGITLAWYTIVLRIAGKPERFQQTATAAFGFQLVMAPLLLASGWLFLTYQKDATWQLPVSFLRLAVEVWALIVLARILRSATGWPMVGCVLLSIAQELITLLLVAGFVPGAVTKAS